jgi:hypothetical protein
MSIDPQFPAELIQRKQWCLWRIEPDKSGRATKVHTGQTGAGLRIGANVEPRAVIQAPMGEEGEAAGAEVSDSALINPGSPRSAELGTSARPYAV